MAVKMTLVCSQIVLSNYSHVCQHKAGEKPFRSYFKPTFKLDHSRSIKRLKRICRKLTNMTFSDIEILFSSSMLHIPNENKQAKLCEFHLMSFDKKYATFLERFVILFVSGMLVNVKTQTDN